MSELEPKIDPDKPFFLMPDLKGPQGNAWCLLGAAQRAFKEHGSPKELAESFHEEATSGDYEHLLATILVFFNVVIEKREFVVLGDLSEMDGDTT